MHVLDQERSKPDNHSEKFQALRVISYEIQAPEISWDVEFDEECIWNWSTKKKENINFLFI